jgi:hypothetical protein
MGKRSYRGLDEFWDGVREERKVQTVRAGLQCFAQRSKGFLPTKFVQSSEAIVDKLTAVTGIDRKSFTFAISTVTRITKQSEKYATTPSDNAQRSAILLTLHDLSDNHLEESERAQPDWLSLMSLADDFIEFLNGYEPSESDSKALMPSKTAAKSSGAAGATQEGLLAAKDLVGALNHAAQARYLSIGVEELIGTRRYFEPYDRVMLESGREVEQAQFICYRYSSSPGYIVKSFTVVRPPGEDAPVGTFSNFYNDRDGNPTSRTTGVILSFHRAIYLIGEIDNGAALKIVAFPKLSGVSNTITGLLLTQRRNGKHASGRMVFKRTNIKHSDDADICEAPVNDLANEIEPFKSKLRNSIDFELDEPVIFNGVGVLSQDDMVAKVGETFRGKMFIGEGEQKRDFNPAHRTHYTYNAALVLDDD